MRFIHLAAMLAAAAASPADWELVQGGPDADPHAPSYLRRVKDPQVRARFKFATDACKGQGSEKKRYACFKRNWDLYKPHRQNKLNDLRARAARACWKFKNNLLKRAKCFDRHIRDYKGALYKGLLAETEANQDVEVDAEAIDADEGDETDSDDESLMAIADNDDADDEDEEDDEESDEDDE